MHVVSGIVIRAQAGRMLRIPDHGLEPGCTTPACHPIFTGRILRLGGRANRFEYQTAPGAEPNQLQPNGTTANGRRFRQIR
jgi:hypothetical protein